MIVPPPPSRTIAPMGIAGATRDVVAAVMAIVFASTFVDGPVAWAVGLCLLAAVAFAVLQVIADGLPGVTATGVPVESLIVPGVTAIAMFGTIRLVPMGPLVVVALLAGGWLLARVIGTEVRLLAAPVGPSGADRTTVLGQSIVIGFLAFIGIAALVPGGLPDPGSTIPPPAGPQLAALAGADAIVAFLLGYRAAALRTSVLRDVAWFALTSGVLVAISAAAVRAMEIPRILGPALLVLVFFLWDAVHAAPPARRREARRIWETVILVALGIAMAAWSVRLRTSADPGLHLTELRAGATKPCPLPGRGTPAAPRRTIGHRRIPPPARPPLDPRKDPTS